MDDSELRIGYSISNFSTLYIFSEGGRNCDLCEVAKSLERLEIEEFELIDLIDKS